MAQQQPAAVPSWVNTTMRSILRSPFHGAVSDKILLITFTGRKSGKTYSTPVSYTRHNGEVLVFTHGSWWKNLRGGAEVMLRIQGKDLKGHAEPVDGDAAAIADGLAVHLRHVPRDAKYFDVRFDANGIPDPADIQRAVPGTVMIRIKLA